MIKDNSINSLSRLIFENGNLKQVDDQTEKARLYSEYVELLRVEQISRNQRVKPNWIKNWENNSSLFHMVASGRKNKKWINRLTLRNGEIITKKGDIKNAVY